MGMMGDVLFYLCFVIFCALLLGGRFEISSKHAEVECVWRGGGRRAS